MRADRCINCKGMPVLSNTSGEYEFMLGHNEPTCPFRYETHQHSENECVKDWNRHNRQESTK